jgi:hypothetical protein
MMTVRDGIATAGCGAPTTVGALRAGARVRIGSWP